MSNAIMKFLRDEEGATAIEYGLIAGLISIALVTVFGTLKGGIEGLFTRVSAELAKVIPTTGG